MSMESVMLESATYRGRFADHRAESEANGYRVLEGRRLTVFKTVSGIQGRFRSLAEIRPGLGRLGWPERERRYGRRR